MKEDAFGVFINVPFDTDYARLFEALVFVIMACGYRPRGALEENNSGDIRLEKLGRLISESRWSIHDLSRIELSENDLPRFNMPFVLALALGAHRFGGKRHANKSLMIMVAEPYRLPAYLSDLGGNDPSAHHRDPERLIGLVRDYLHQRPDGTILPGLARLAQRHREFQAAIPTIANTIGHDLREIGGFANYKSFTWCVSEFLKA